MFKLKSGNAPKFKAMGSSPLKSHDGTKSSSTHYADGTPKSERDKFNDAETQAEESKTSKSGSGADSTEGQDENKIFDDKGNHIGNLEGDKKVLFKSSPAKSFGWHTKHIIQSDKENRAIMAKGTKEGPQGLPQ